MEWARGTSSDEPGNHRRQRIAIGAPSMVGIFLTAGQSTGSQSYSTSDEGHPSCQ